MRRNIQMREISWVVERQILGTWQEQTVIGYTLKDAMEKWYWKLNYTQIPFHIKCTVRYDLGYIKVKMYFNGFDREEEWNLVL